MEKFITEERTGLRYELVGDYYLIAGDDEPEEQHTIGIWGQRHLRYLKEHRRVLYPVQRPDLAGRYHQGIYRG